MKKGKATQAIHGRRDQSFRSTNFPIYQSTNFAVDKSDDYRHYIADEEEFYIYSRYHNPTVQNVTEKLAKLENGESALIFSSGMAAITSTILSFVEQDDLIAASSQLYGMTYRFLRDKAPKFGIKVKFLSEKELYDVDSICPDAKAVYFETPINPSSPEPKSQSAAGTGTGAVVICRYGSSPELHFPEVSVMASLLHNWRA